MSVRTKIVDDVIDDYNADHLYIKRLEIKIIWGNENESFSTRARQMLARQMRQGEAEEGFINHLDLDCLVSFDPSHSSTKSEDEISGAASYVPFEERQGPFDVVIFTTKLPRTLIRDLLPKPHLMRRLMPSPGLVSLALAFEEKPIATGVNSPESEREFLENMEAMIQPLVQEMQENMARIRELAKSDEGMAQLEAEEPNVSEEIEREDDGDDYANHDLWLVGVRAAIPLSALNKRVLGEVLSSLSSCHKRIVELLRKHGFLS
ncbi:MAG TPA: hypothetical protein VFI31_23235 [Pirellulales bacterium]|nr:hypothetical protein [Pirellulales bacterium]